MPKKTKKTKKTTQKQKQKQSVNVKIHIDQSKRTNPRNTPSKKAGHYSLPAPHIQSLPAPSMVLNSPLLPLADNKPKTDELQETKQLVNALVLRNIHQPEQQDIPRLIDQYISTPDYNQQLYQRLMQQHTRQTQRPTRRTQTEFKTSEELTKTGLQTAKPAGVNLDDEEDDEAVRLIGFQTPQDSTQTGFKLPLSAPSHEAVSAPLPEDEEVEYVDIEEDETKEEVVPPKKKMTKQESARHASAVRLARIQEKKATAPPPAPVEKKPRGRPKNKP